MTVSNRKDLLEWVLEKKNDKNDRSPNHHKYTDRLHNHHKFFLYSQMWNKEIKSKF